MISDYTTPTPLQIYRDMFRDLLRTKSNRLIQNNSTAHAQVLIAELISFARKCVDIYCSELSPDVWDHETIVSAVRQAIERGVCIRVLVQRCPTSKVLKPLLDASAVRVKIGGEVSVANFIVVDGRSFRIELDERQRTGMACAFDEENARVLSISFDKMFLNPVERTSEMPNTIEPIPQSEA